MSTSHTLLSRHEHVPQRFFPPPIPLLPLSHFPLPPLQHLLNLFQLPLLISLPIPSTPKPLSPRLFPATQPTPHQHHSKHTFSNTLPAKPAEESVTGAHPQT
ncbi:hypothetical protein K469DRAFT_110722 [Zopfia rhizophila CBS 207.26]|uniref:Uncharacterized protein n=1 Tax=Zopfia rhizophila CBS 207.26 TaxID=1314779 RepID=A0A6A6E9M9_9PEZI|nr:hypothetical protein K469DRAFT_110722 [Zopfia rhizophila CBS 207.26]